MANSLIVTTRNVYGAETIYPVNETAFALARIAGTKTLRLQDIATAAAAFGLSVVCQNNESTGFLFARLRELSAG